jgi:hypothetical protein
MLRTDNMAGPYLSDGDLQEVFGSEYLDDDQREQPWLGSIMLRIRTPST